MHKIAFLFIVAAALTFNACSTVRDDAPSDNGVHSEAWIVDHSVEVAGSTNLGECTECHGSDLSGGGGVPSCYSCHSFNTAPPFVVHPDTWADAYADHRAYAASNGYDDCRGCHGADLKGTPAAPSCFSASYSSQGCHEGGPGAVPHPLDGSFLDGSVHGPVAKQDLTMCQACHGQAGGPGDNPRFNLGIDSEGGNGCESCHGINMAHPQNWAGPNDTFHYSAGNIQNACTLCHGADLDGVGGVGPSCLQCHDDTATFTLDCTACHGYPPDATDLTIGSEVIVGVDHSAITSTIAWANHSECSICHGMKESGAGGSFDPTANYLLFDKGTDTIGYHWDGNIQMNGDANYNETTHGCAVCHGSDTSAPLSDSGLPVDLESFGL